MITLRPSAERGSADLGWLQARYSFSFAQYHDPAWMGFSDLRVINQDRIAPAGGFNTHGHENMEIVTYVLEGALEHKDSMGQSGVLRAGEVQLMSAGSGVRHSEFNASQSEPLHLLQMWILPAKDGTVPNYQQEDFSERLDGRLALCVSPDGAEDSLRIGQDTRMYAGRPRAGQTLELELRPGRKAWLHLAKGSIQLNGITLNAGDGAAIEDESRLVIDATRDSDLVLFDLS
jgi:quercetin 2,3-dioxygenase